MLLRFIGSVSGKRAQPKGRAMARAVLGRLGLVG